jgi:hypothetical protein
MRTLLLLGLISFWLTHPGAIRALLHVAALAVGALAHAGGHYGAAGTILLYGSHWH